MAHPQSLAKAGKAGPVVLFARNRLCALVKTRARGHAGQSAGAHASADIKLGTSTPKADPPVIMRSRCSARPRRSRPAAARRWRQKALQLTGGADERAAARWPQRLWLACRGRPRRHLPRLLHGGGGRREGKSRAADRDVARCARGRRGLRADRDERRLARRIPVRDVHPVDGGTRHIGEARLRGAGIVGWVSARREPRRVFFATWRVTAPPTLQPLTWASGGPRSLRPV